MNGPDARTRVLIADARGDVREALAALLDTTDDFEVVGQACSMDEAARCCPELQPDIVVADPNGEYDDTLGMLATGPRRLILLTLRDGATCRTTARSLGAVVVDKGASPEHILATLRAAAR